MATPNMSLAASDVDKSVVIGSLETAVISENDYVSFYDISAQFEPKQRKTTIADIINIIRQRLGSLPQAGASDAGKTVVVGDDGTYELSEVKVDAIENFIIAPDEWQHSTSIFPFNWYADKTAETPIGTNSVVELINNDPFNFTVYGFAIAQAAGQTIRFIACSVPEDHMSMKVIIHG